MAGSNDLYVTSRKTCGQWVRECLLVIFGIIMSRHHVTYFLNRGHLWSCRLELVQTGVKHQQEVTGLIKMDESTSYGFSLNPLPGRFK